MLNPSAYHLGSGSYGSHSRSKLAPATTPEDPSDAVPTLGICHLSDDERLKMAAVAFMRLGVTKPTSWQWQAAHERLLAPVLISAANRH
jgi:hypothetical protein